jgi:hypothetical protein
MGIDDWDDQRGSRGQAPRRRGAYDNGEPPAERSSQRGRPRGYDEQPPARSSGRRGGYARDDDPRASSSGRYVPGGQDRSGNDRRPRPDQSGAGRRPRSDWDDDATVRRERRGPADQYARGDRSGRGPRPPTRDEWETSARLRGGPRSPADAGARNRRAGAAVAGGRGGLWDDEPLGGRRGMMDARDPRARRGQVEEDDEETSRGAAFGKALLAIVLALVIGAGAAYGYYLYSTPKIPAGVSQPNSVPASGTPASGTPASGTPASGTPASGSSGSSFSPHTTTRSAPLPAAFSGLSHTFILLASS